MWCPGQGAGRTDASMTPGNLVCFWTREFYQRVDTSSLNLAKPAENQNRQYWPLQLLGGWHHGKVGDSLRGAKDERKTRKAIFLAWCLCPRDQQGARRPHSRPLSGHVTPVQPVALRPVAPAAAVAMGTGLAGNRN